MPIPIPALAPVVRPEPGAEAEAGEVEAGDCIELDGTCVDVLGRRSGAVESESEFVTPGVEITVTTIIDGVMTPPGGADGVTIWVIICVEGTIDDCAMICGPVSAMKILSSVA